MKKKARRNQKELDKISCGSAETFPTQLSREDYFKCPIWFADSPQFVKDLNKASWTASKLEAGQVYVNKWFTGSHATPFGGYKQSGYSREKGVDALKSYLQVKNVGISLS